MNYKLVELKSKRLYNTLIGRNDINVYPSETLNVTSKMNEISRLDHKPAVSSNNSLIISSYIMGLIYQAQNNSYDVYIMLQEASPFWLKLLKEDMPRVVLTGRQQDYWILIMDDSNTHQLIGVYFEEEDIEIHFAL
ncbi:hypothetical protein HNR42_003125 [Deinobacterium chartae]|uniref:Uncharacterized protein n=1 Tax=Deinobacterium chartae TaxID=521158 RepID=A0A841I1V0_9DEIO|nr:hypothetical protein [Deinobacterium chartae]MBB6099667.1 hypothetical protein [Deinobacterium chartae]